MPLPSPHPYPYNQPLSMIARLAPSLPVYCLRGELQARHWEQFVEAIGLGKAQAKKRILELAKTLPTKARQLQTSSERGFTNCDIVEQIIALIEQPCALTIRRLTTATTDAT